MNKLLELRHPFFAPLWRRVLTTALCTGWAVIEFTSGGPFFGVLFTALALWTGYHFFLSFNPDDYKDPDA